MYVFSFGEECRNFAPTLDYVKKIYMATLCLLTICNVMKWQRRTSTKHTSVRIEGNVCKEKETAESIIFAYTCTTKRLTKSKEAAKKNSTAAFAKIVINNNVWRQRNTSRISNGFCHFCEHACTTAITMFYICSTCWHHALRFMSVHTEVFLYKYFYRLTIQYSVRHHLKLETRSEGRLSVLWHRWNRQCMCSSGVSVSWSPT